MNDRNLTLLTDFYELTMGNGYFQTAFKGAQMNNKIAFLNHFVIRQ